jgi:glycosyltransferase involved in cell wall biosynthesis
MARDAMSEERARPRSNSGAGGRAAARVSARAFGAAIALIDLTSPGLRYGYVHPLARAILRRPLASLGAVHGAAFRPSAAHRASCLTDVRCGLVADSLDVGGVGRVVEMLAEGLRSAGVEPVVICPADGQRTARLRDLGLEVIVAPDAQTASEAVAQAHLDVFQLHSAPGHLVDAARATGAPLLPVLHNTEIHYSPEMWRRTAELFSQSDAVIAVSALVRQFHLDRLPADTAAKIVVVANGAMAMPAVTEQVRSRARDALAEALETSLAGEVVFACLARYDSQKNIAGTVASFLAAPTSKLRVRLVVAGDPSDWFEYRRADAIRRSHPDGDRVHLLGNSDAATLLAAADAFILDSFFEGWPLSATEAVAAGLPIVLSEAGGAAELVQRARRGSVLISNASGPAAAVSDRRARAARRRADHQPNATEVVAAITAVAGTVREVGRGEPSVDDSFGAMVTGHASLIRVAAATRDSHADAVVDGVPVDPTWQRPGATLRRARAVHTCGYAVLTGLTGVVDVLPGRIRFGHVRTLTQLALGLHNVPRLAAVPRVASDGPGPEGEAAAETPRMVCALVTETLDVGGVEAVVGMLALELPRLGIACSVVTLHGGRQAEILRGAGVRVAVVDDAAGLSAALVEIGPDVVQVHTATPPMIDVLIAAGVPLVPVVHNVELYRGAPAWEATTELSRSASVTIAVSDAVRRDHLGHVEDRGRGLVTVIPNGAPRAVVESAPPRSVARAHLAAALKVDVSDDVIVVSLARYDIQKNPVGLVDAFLVAASRDRRLRLVMAGETGDWLEFRRADELRLSHPGADRVHLLGESDAGTLLAAADIFALNSYFEGWPVAVTEARTLGLPVVMSDVGGAHELVGVDASAGIVVANPSGSILTPRTVARARRRLHQPSRSAFADALVAQAAAGPDRATSVRAGTREQMVASHADVLLRVAGKA